MYRIVLTTNDNTNKKFACIVSKAQYNRINNAQNIGGFKRYDVELYSDNEPKQRSEINFALSFLAVNVFYCTVSDLKQFI
jgi:hypothetical protein